MNLKKLTLIGACALLSTTAMAQVVRVDRDDVLNRRREFARETKINEIKELALQVSVLSASRIITLTDEDLDALSAALTSSKNILRGRSNPTPTRPTRPRPVEKYISCEQETTNNLDFTQKTNVARAISRIADNQFGMFSSDADKFAQEWMKKYPCEVVEQYSQNAVAIEKVADDYMGMFSSDASRYALSNVDKVCDSETIVNSARSINRYADNELGMFSSDADKYTRNWIETNELKCNIPKAGDVK